MPFFDGAQGRVYYRHWQAENTRAAIVFLHGFGEHTGVYHRYAAELGAHGIDLWALDEIGHGLTDGDRGQVGSFEDLVTNAETLTDIARTSSAGLPLIIAGHSLGSLAAVLTAVEHPGAYAAVVISGAPLSPLEWLTQAGTTLDLDPADLSSDPFYLDQLETDPLAFTSGDVVETLNKIFPGAWARIESDLPGLALPILAVHGANDPIAPLDGVLRWRDRVPGLRVEVIEDAGHDVLNEVAHKRVADTVAAFVLDITGNGPEVITNERAGVISEKESA